MKEMKRIFGYIVLALVVVLTLAIAVEADYRHQNAIRFVMKLVNGGK